MPRTSSLLIRWQGGWLNVEATPVGRRREAGLNIGPVSDFDAVKRDGERLLSLLGSTTDTIVVAVEPRTEATMPFVGWQLGPATTVTAPGFDADAAHRVASALVSEDDDGYLNFGLELVDQTQDSISRMQKWLKRMAAAAVGGKTWLASPERPQWEPTPPTRRPTAVFTQSGVDANGELLPVFYGRSPDLPAESMGELREWFIYVTTPGTTSTVADLLVNNVVVGTAVIAPGAYDGRAYLSGLPVVPNRTRLACFVTSPGTGATGFGGQARVDAIAT